MALAFQVVSRLLMRELQSAIPRLSERITIPLAATAKVAPAMSPSGIATTKGQLLLAVGRAGVPTEVTNELSVMYGLLKYAALLGPGNRLVFTPSTRDIDTHKKAVMSDEFGCGVSLLYAEAVFGVRHVMDFESARRAGLVSVPASASKRPDFAFRDNSGRIVLLESKGTTQSRSHSLKQVAAGCKQLEPPKLTGRWAGTPVRLACGTHLNLKAGTGAQAHLDDPEGEGTDSYELIIDPAEAMVRAHYYRIATTIGDFELASALSRVRRDTNDVGDTDSDRSVFASLETAGGSAMFLTSTEGDIRLFFGIDAAIRRHLLAAAPRTFEQPRMAETTTLSDERGLSISASDGTVMRIELEPPLGQRS